jgi:hypothetical protein
VVRVTRKTGRGLAGDQKFGQLGMTLVELGIVGCDFFQDGCSFLKAVILVHQADHQFGVAGLRDQPSLPAGVGEVIEGIRRFVLFH